jgi:hypothetical protein
MEDFHDIKIIGFAEELVRASEKGEDFKLMPLQLSGIPPTGWASLLEWRYAQSHPGIKRSVKVEGAHIYVDCVPEELALILEELKPMVAATNADHRSSIAQQRQLLDDAQGKSASDKERVEAVKKKLKFD